MGEQITPELEASDPTADTVRIPILHDPQIALGDDAAGTGANPYSRHDASPSARPPRPTLDGMRELSEAMKRARGGR